MVIADVYSFCVGATYGYARATNTECDVSVIFPVVFNALQYMWFFGQSAIDYNERIGASDLYPPEEEPSSVILEGVRGGVVGGVFSGLEMAVGFGCGFVFAKLS
jgi:hypothetical protein